MLVLVLHFVVNSAGELFVLTPVGWYLKSEFGAVNWWFILLLIQRLWLALWHKACVFECHVPVRSFVEKYLLKRRYSNMT